MPPIASFETTMAASLPHYKVGDRLTFMTKTGKIHPVIVKGILRNEEISFVEFRNGKLTKKPFIWPYKDFSDHTRPMTQQELIDFLEIIGQQIKREQEFMAELASGSLN